MKISNDSLLTNIVGNKYDAAVSDMTKSLMQLKSGDTFSGTVIDIKQNSVTLQLDNDLVINAKSMVTPDLRIGEKAAFTVKESNVGQIFVEISKTEEGMSNIIKELLDNIKLPNTKENVDFVKFLIDNNMPVDKKTISDGLYFKYANELAQTKSDDNILQGKENILNSNGNVSAKNFQIGNTSNILEKVLFLLKEEMPAGKVTVDTLNRLIDSNTGLKSEFSSIASEISKMPDNELKQKLLEIFDIDKNNFSSPRELKNAISNKLMFNKNDIKSQEALSSKFEKIFETVSKSSEIISEMPDKLPNDVIKQNFENVKNDLNFMKEIDNYKEYIQIPININGRESECELHIFKNAKGKNDYSKRASVLLSLDYFYIGKIDAFIEKIDKNLTFQFKCDKKDTINIIKKNINELSNLLGNYGFNITNVTYKEKDESFNIVKNKTESNNKNVSKKRYSFDMRV